MAYETLVSTESRHKIRELLRDVCKEKGGFNLALLAQSPDFKDKWTLVISAPWIDAEGSRAAVTYMSSNLKRRLDRRALSAIERISALRSNHRLVSTILDFLGLEVSLDSDAHIVRDFKVEEVRFPLAFIFIADRHPGQGMSEHYISSGQHQSVRR